MRVNVDFLGYLLIRAMVFILGCILLIHTTAKIISYCIIRYNSSAVYGDVIKQGCGTYIGCKPEVVYRDNNGVTHQIKSTINFHWFVAPKKGAKMKVLFRRDAPQISIIDSILHYIVIPFVFVVLGSILVISAFSGRIKRTVKITDEAY